MKANQKFKTNDFAIAGASEMVGVLIAIMLVLLIGVSMVTPIADTVDSAKAPGGNASKSNLTGTQKTLIDIVPLIFVVIILLLAVGAIGLATKKF